MAISTFEADEIVARANVNQRINQANAYFPVTVANGGTGQTSLEGIRSSLGVMKPTTLFNNPSGMTNTIILSDSIDNYEHIVIYYSGYDTSHRNFSGFWRNANVNSYGVVLNVTYPQGDLKGFISREALVTVSGDTITFSRNATIMFNGSSGGNVWTFNNEKILILRVNGYSY